ncbi:MAG: aromatic acid exporter family protein [Gorillibacterium sp.]|nr:aromatic acid exporter family protein [Gorillibacterium sp.]
MNARIIKSTLAAIIAIYFSLFLSLTNPYSAGLLAILGTDTTKRKSLKSVSVRFLSCAFGILLASAGFLLFGFHVWVIGLYILIAYTALYRVKLQDGIVPSAVIMLHLYTAKEITLPLIWNELLLIAIGFGVAAILNVIYAPQAEKYLQLAKSKLEDDLSTIFSEISFYLIDRNRLWDGSELLSAMKQVKEGRSRTQEAKENSLFQITNEWDNYFQMRNQQLYSTQRMLDLVSQVDETLPHGEAVSEVFADLSEDVKNTYYTGKVEVRLIALEKEFKQMPLPSTRSEFEARSALLQLCLELKTYLSVAKEMKRKKPTGRESEMESQGWF